MCTTIVAGRPNAVQHANSTTGGEEACSGCYDSTVGTTSGLLHSCPGPRPRDAHVGKSRGTRVLLLPLLGI